MPPAETTPTRRESAPEVTPASPSPAPEPARADAALILDDLLVEDVSIDGMCGVY